MAEAHATMQCDVAVIGGGPAGLAAALAAKAADPSLRVLLLDREGELGGILKQCIHNGFGLTWFGEELTGPEYAQRFIDQLAGAGVEWMSDTMVLSLSSDRSIWAVNPIAGLFELRAGAVVLAMGCRERTRGAVGIPGTRPAGIYTAGTAQWLTNIAGHLPGRRAVVLGSGDIGLIMARRLTWEGAKVALVAELLPYSSGLNRNIVQCLDDNDIPLLFNHTVVKVHGDERVEGVTVAAVDPATRLPIAGSEAFYECDTLLLSVGLIPENELSREAGIEIDPVTSGAVVDERRQTSLPGVFAAGNVLHVHDLVDNVSAEAELAGRAAAAWVRSGGEEAAGEGGRLVAGPGVRYVVPQRLSPGASGKVSLYFRVGAAYQPATLVVEQGGREILRRRRQIMTPGEMEVVKLDAALLREGARLSIEEAKRDG